MNILFVCGGNSLDFSISPFIKVQAESLQRLGHNVDFYCVTGKGTSGYLRNVLPLKRIIQSTTYDVVHAHYSFCGIVSWLSLILLKRIHIAPKKRKLQSTILVTSLLGSDVFGSRFKVYFLAMMANMIWDVLIVKSIGMKNRLGLSNVHILPNGVDLARFHELDRNLSKKNLGLAEDIRYILFSSSPNRKVKNYPLAASAYEKIKSNDTKLITLGNVPHSQVPEYINASNVLILTSLWEGSPNIVKEAMACNCPIVSTDVGDVRWLFGDLAGYYISSSDPAVFARRIDEALSLHSKTNGVSRIKALELDSESIAQKLLQIYQNDKAV